MKPTSNPRDNITFDAPQTVTEATAQLNMTNVQAQEHMPKFAHHQGNVSIALRRSGQREAVAVRPAGRQAGEETSWSYTVYLDTGEAVDDTDEMNEAAREVAGRIASGDYQPPASM